MSHITSNTAVDDVFATYINRKFISDLEYALQHQKFCTNGTLTKGGGANVLRFVEFVAPTPAASGPLTSYSAAGMSSMTEATTSEHEITGITTSATNVTVAEYGEFLKIGKLYEYAAVKGTREKLEKRLRDGGAGSIDSAVRIVAKTSTNVVYATAAASGGTLTGPSAITAMGAATLMFARKTLFGGLAKGIEGVSGHPNGHYAAVLTPQQELDVITEVTTSRVYWNNAVVNVPGKMGQEKWVNGYIGSIYGVATYVTQNYQTVSYTAGADVGFVYADGGIGCASFDQMEARIVINDVNSPYKNVNSIAWHAMFGVGLVSGTRVAVIYSDQP